MHHKSWTYCIILTLFLPSNSLTPLLLAVSEGHTDVAKLLLEGGADMHVVDKDEKTVIFWAAAKGNVQTLQVIFLNIEVGFHAAVHVLYVLCCTL